MTNFIAVSGGNKMKLDFVLDSQGNPVKLGDGTFGCVFHVRDSTFRDYALKIFYESSDEFVLTSQEQETGLGSKLRECFQRQGQRERIDEIDRYLVVSQAQVSEFKSTKAYKLFESYFRKMKFKVSDNAIVMAIYPMSLKDILERGWPTSKFPEKTEAPGAEASTGAIGRELDGGFGEKSGYSILLSIPQTEREKCILPIVLQIAEALSILRDAGCNHQDIKPANILLRKVGQGLQVALADLGFINTGQFQVHGSMFKNQPLGTRHYRSPEQTDFFDICEVDIHRREDDGDYDLTTHDPKFRDTFSESGDLVVFSKLPEPTQWKIKEITFPSSQEGRSGITTIRIEGLQHTELHNDVRTQITINKRQTDRTDLFGLGAIIFDMLTCGRSPEQFYDLLRIHNREVEIEKGLAQRYVHFRNGGGTVPEIDAIFQNMRVDANSEFPHPDIVKIILKCMMSKPSDSYWNSGRWKSVKADLNALIKDLNCHNYNQIGVNHLTRFDSSPGEGSRQHSDSPEDGLREIQHLSYGKTDECVKRLILGIQYLDKIAQMVKAEMGDSPKLSYLANIAPKSLADQKGAYYSPRHVFFEKEENFNAVIESGNPLALVQLFSAGGLRPPFIDTLVREGEVWVSKEQQGRALKDGICLGYELWGREGGRFWEEIKGGRLLLDLSITDRVNREIIEIDRSRSTLYVSGKNNLAKKLSVDTGRYRAYFVKKFDRTHYYLSMFGVYIRLLFFVDPHKYQTHTPQSIYFFEEGRSLDRTKFADFPSFSTSSSGRRWFSGRSEPSNESLSKLFSLMAGIYARLLTLELDFDDKSPQEIVDDYIGKIRQAMVSVLNCDSQNELMNQKLVGARNNLSVSEFPDINKFVNENIISQTSPNIA